MFLVKSIIKNKYIMKISKVRDVKTPTRGTVASAGLDFYVPNDFQEKQLMPGESVVIPSGIKANVPKGKALIAFNKSGIAVKRSLYVGACVVDEDYQGEIHINLVNTGYMTVHIKPGEKIIQWILLDVSYFNPVIVPENKLFTKTTERGEGWKGSTGTK